MKVFWYKSNNFGDALTPYLVEKITGHKAQQTYPERAIGTGLPVHMVTGSIMGDARSNCVVWGAGFGNFSEKVKQEPIIKAVRGKLTRNMLLADGRECPAVYGDPGLLMPKYYFPKIKKTHEYGIMPHYVDLNSYQLMYRGGLQKHTKLINILHPVEKVIDQVLSCEHIISSSLHGLIIANAYGIPATWVKLSDKVLGDGMKFFDYFSSVDIEPYKVSKTNWQNILEMDYSELTFRSVKPEKLKYIQDTLMKECPL